MAADTAAGATAMKRLQPEQMVWRDHAHKEKELIDNHA
jgi:hypothetical protein